MPLCQVWEHSGRRAFIYEIDTKRHLGCVDVPSPMPRWLVREVAAVTLLSGCGPRGRQLRRMGAPCQGGQARIRLQLGWPNLFDRLKRRDRNPPLHSLARRSSSHSRTRATGPIWHGRHWGRCGGVRPVAAFRLLATPTRTWVVAARPLHGRLKRSVALLHVLHHQRGWLL
jgi:hypothetical protein